VKKLLSYELELVPSRVKKLSETAIVYYTELGLKKWFNNLAGSMLKKLIDGEEIPIYREVNMDTGRVKEIEIRMRNPLNYFLNKRIIKYSIEGKKIIVDEGSELNLVDAIKCLSEELRECNPFILENYLKLKIGVKDKKDL